MEVEKISPAEMIVDLFELRNTYISPLEKDKFERIQFDYQYHSLSAAISCLISKYKVRGLDIEDEIAKRRVRRVTH